MEEIILEIKNNNRKYTQCDLCMCKEGIIEVNGKGLYTTMNICKKCITKIMEFIK